MSSMFGIDKDELRAKLPIREVARQLTAEGYSGPHIMADGTALCPFHADSEPSFYLFDGNDGAERWWCQPCGFGGDIFDLIMRTKGVPFPEAKRVAQAMWDARPADWDSRPQATAKPKVTVEQVTENIERVTAARQFALTPEVNGHLALSLDLVRRDDPDPIGLATQWDAHLRDRWGWGLDREGTIYMPHWDRNLQFTGCKTRYGNRKGSLPGSTYPDLYGSFHGRTYTTVLLTEGESDAVYADWLALREGVAIDVFALPAGAQKPPTAEQVAFLGNPDVLYLALDPDTPGVAATWRWVDFLLTNGISKIRVCRLPLGQDLRQTRPRLTDLLAHAKAPLLIPDGIAESNGVNPGYARRDSDGGWNPITSWLATPYAFLRGNGENDEAGFEVEIDSRHRRERGVMRLSDLASTQSLNRWANKYGMIFNGTEGDRKILSQYIEARGSIVPEVFSVPQVGAHQPPDEYAFAGPTVVYAEPNTYVGKMPFTYAPTTKFKELRPDEILLPCPDERFSWRWITDFLDLSTPDVTHPLLAWLIASARRHEVESFPLLFIGGSSGVGKSTLAGIGTRLMGSAISIDLGSVTPFILVKALACTTNIPVFVDEWTRLSRPDTREAFQSNISNLYAGGNAERGQADLTTTSYPMLSPVIVAGEDTFKLTREKDRTVVIYPTRGHQNPAALERLKGEPLQAFGEALHWYLFSGERREPIVPMPGVHATRPLYNEAILRAGWGTLHNMIDYYAHHLGDSTYPDLPVEPDLSVLARAEEEDNTYAAIVTAGLPLKDSAGNPVAWIDETGRGTWIRAEALAIAVERSTDLKAPGSKTAMLNYFREEFGDSAVEYNRHAKPPGFSKRLGATLIHGFLPQDPADSTDEMLG